MPQDVVNLIMNDHREVERLFDLMVKQPQPRPNLLPVLTALLTAHSRAEEAEVYPAAAAAGGADEVEHSQEEHVQADVLLERLAVTDPEEPAFDVALAELMEAITHHVEEEESTVLPGMRERVSADELRRLGEAFLASRAEHLGEQPGDITKDQLRQQAANMDADVRSDLPKAKLEQELRAQAGG